MTPKLSHKREHITEATPYKTDGETMKITDYLSDSFTKECNLYWTNLSHLTSLLIVVNLSMFFVTRLVIDEGYYYTFYSLGFLLMVELLILIPIGLIEKLWFYLMCLFFEFVAIYFIVVSIWYWVITNKV